MEKQEIILSDEEKLKIKRQKRNQYMKTYRDHKTEAFIKCRDKSNKKYYEKIKTYRIKYQELLNNGLLEKLNTLNLNSS